PEHAIARMNAARTISAYDDPFAAIFFSRAHDHPLSSLRDTPDQVRGKLFPHQGGRKTCPVYFLPPLWGKMPRIYSGAEGGSARKLTLRSFSPSLNAPAFRE